MTTITLTRVKFDEQPQEGQTYTFEDSSFIAELLAHPDFQVPGEKNVEVTVMDMGDWGYPIEIERQQQNGHMYSMLVGHIDVNPHELNL